jgi:hypothetical protein
VLQVKSGNLIAHGWLCLLSLSPTFILCLSVCLSLKFSQVRTEAIRSCCDIAAVHINSAEPDVLRAVMDRRLDKKVSGGRHGAVC